MASYTRSKVLYFASKTDDNGRPLGMHVSTSEFSKGTTLAGILNRLKGEGLVKPMSPPEGGRKGQYFALTSKGRLALLREKLEYSFNNQEPDKFKSRAEDVLEYFKSSLDEEGYRFFASTLHSDGEFRDVYTQFSKIETKALDFMVGIGLLKSRDSMKIKSNPIALMLKKELEAITINPNLIFPEKTRETKNADVSGADIATSEEGLNLALLDWFGKSSSAELDVDVPNEMLLLNRLVHSGDVVIKAKDDAYAFVEITQRGIARLKSFADIANTEIEGPLIENVDGVRIPSTFNINQSLEDYRKAGHSLLSQLGKGEVVGLDSLHWDEMHDKRTSLYDAIDDLVDLRNPKEELGRQDVLDSPSESPSLRR
jgi:DNA-binding PadR family transcriptional regulator